MTSVIPNVDHAVWVPAFAGTTPFYWIQHATIHARLAVATSSAHSIQIHIANGMRHVLAFSRRIAPELCDRPALRKIERAQGMPGEGLTHGPPATKKQAAVTTGSADHRHSLRDGFNAYT
jgi:hypothetical protein